MPPIFDQTNKEKPLEKVSNLRNFLGSCVKLLNDINSLQILQNILEKFHLGEEGVNPVNQVQKKRRTGCNIPVLTLMNYNVLCKYDLGW
jgi:hypothetical protein